MNRENHTSQSSARPCRSEMPAALPHIGELIRAVVREHKLTGAWLASRLGCDRTNVYKMFKKHTIDTQLLLRVAVILNYDFFEVYSAEVQTAIDRRAHS